MKPNLLSLDLPLLGRLDFPAYFTLLLLGFLFAILIAQRETRRRGLDPNAIIDLGIWVLIAGILGARLLHVLADGYFWDYVYTCQDPYQTNWGYNQGECLRYRWTWLADEGRCIPPEPNCWLPLQFWKGGLAYYGGLLLGIPVGAYVVIKKGLGLGNGADVVGLGLPVGLAFGRIGCFLAGCCFGTVCDLPWGVSFPAGSEASKQQAILSQKVAALFPDYAGYLPISKYSESLPVHPTQLYEAIACVLIVLYLYFGLRPKQRFVGQLFWASLLLYGLARFVIEFVRNDDRGALFGLSTSQLIAIPMIVGSAIALLVLPKRLPRFEIKP